MVRHLDTQGVVTSIEMQPDGGQFFTADSQTATLWSLEGLQVKADASELAAEGSSLTPRTLQVVRSWELSHGCESASYCPAKGKFVAGGADMWVYLHDAATGEELECNKGAPLACCSCRPPLMACRQAPAAHRWVAALPSPPPCSLQVVRRAPWACALPALCARWQLICVWL